MNPASNKVDCGAGSRAMVRIGLVVALLLAGVIAFGAYVVVRAARRGAAAEERLQAVRMVGSLIAEHVEKSPTHAWPTSWGDLEKLSYAYHMWGGWPAGSERVKAIVKVDFATTTADVLRQTPALCTAVTVTPGPNFQGSPQGDLIPMFERLRAAVARGSSVDTDQGQSR